MINQPLICYSGQAHLAGQTHLVIPAQAGIQQVAAAGTVVLNMDSRLRGSDDYISEGMQ